MMRFHLLGLAHVPVKWDECLCPFTTLAFNMAKMIKTAGHELVVYAPERSEVECDELVPVVSWSTLEKTADNKGTFRFRWHNSQEDPAWKEHVSRAAPELAKRYRPGDIALISYGYFQSYAKNVAKLAVEYICGYSGVFADYRVFPSYAWFHHINGWLKRETNPSWYDVVIPHYLDFNQWPLIEKKQDYLAYIGRLDPIKGVDIAADAAEACGMELRVAGRWGNEETLPPYLEGKSHVKYLGALRHRDRVELVANARATMCVSRWIEAFGMTSIESMACGTPVISSDFGAHSETNIQGVTGFRCRDFDEMVRAVEDCRSVSPAMIRQSAASRYDLPVVWPQYERYFEMIRRHANSRGGWYARKGERRPAPVMPETRETMAALLPKNGVAAEIGVLEGDYSEVLLRRAEPATLYLVDAWQHQPPEVYADPNNVGQQTQDRRFSATRDRFAGDPRVVLRREYSTDFFASIPTASLDWVYIDANHGQDAVLSDLRQAALAVRPGGWICGHDYIEGWYGFGVVQAVKTFLGENPNWRLEMLTQEGVPSFGLRSTEVA
jgi:glycosyltransferase involved in cell wall biosynthesis